MAQSFVIASIQKFASEFLQREIRVRRVWVLPWLRGGVGIFMPSPSTYVGGAVLLFEACGTSLASTDSESFSRFVEIYSMFNT